MSKMIDTSGNTLVNVTQSVLPTGAATGTKQDTGNTSVASIDTKTPALVSGRVPVDGSGVTQPVSGTVSANLNAGTNNIGDVDVLTVPADPFGANADAVVAAGAAGSIQAKLRRATQGLEDLKTGIVLAAGANAVGKLAANSGVDIGDVDILSVTPGTGATNLGKAEDAAHTSSDVGVMALAVRRDANTSLVDGSAVTQPVSGTVGITANSAVNVAQVAGTNTDTNSGNKSAGTIRVVLATDQPALTNKLLVTPDSVALPANQSVNVNQIVGTAADVNSGLKSAGTLRVVLATDQPALTNKLLVTPDSVALPANQSVNVNQLAGTATDVNSGNKSAGTLRVVLATDQPALTNALLVAGDIAHDGVDSGNPVKVGGKAATALPAVVSANDRTNLLTDVYGRPFFRSGEQGPAGSLFFTSHEPAANAQATKTQAAAGAGIRNVCTGFTVTFAAGATAPAAVQVAVRLRDGATGVGTVLWAAVLSLPATAGVSAGITRQNLWIPGTANTAMTLEFSQLPVELTQFKRCRSKAPQ
jgi:hypothetical protein